MARRDSRVHTIMVYHDFVSLRAMKNLTISIDEEVARWARIRAAEQNTSVSRLVEELLRESRRAERGYEAAKNHYLSQKPVPLKRAGRYPCREAVHERKRFR